MTCILPRARLGKFLSAYGTPFAQRALPPSSFGSTYYVYRVVKQFVVLAGPIQPAFYQPGQGIQYWTALTNATGNGTLYNSSTNTSTSVADLIRNGYLVESSPNMYSGTYNVPAGCGAFPE